MIVNNLAQWLCKFEWMAELTEGTVETDEDDSGVYYGHPVNEQDATLENAVKYALGHCIFDCIFWAGAILIMASICILSRITSFLPERMSLPALFMCITLVTFISGIGVIMRFFFMLPQIPVEDASQYKKEMYHSMEFNVFIRSVSLLFMLSSIPIIIFFSKDIYVFIMVTCFSLLYIISSFRCVNTYVKAEN